MSYNRMQQSDKLTGHSRPVQNGERYPPIPLPPPPALHHGQAAAPFLENGPIIINSTPAIIEGLDDGLETKTLLFNDQSIRKGFIRKVYAILLVQLVLTSGVISIFTYHEPTKWFVRKNPVVFVVAVVVNFVVLISMACCETARRRFPINFVCLGLFTATMSLMLGVVATTFDENTVLLAVGITALLVATLSIFAIQTRFDFTAMGGVLITMLVCLLILTFAGAYLERALGRVAVACFGGLIASFLLIYDTQLIIGGTHQYQFNPEDYIFAALTLYMDVVRIFLYVLRLIGRK